MIIVSSGDNSLLVIASSDEDEEEGEEEGGEEDPEIGIELIVADGGNGNAMDTGQFDDADMGPEH